MRVWGLDFYVYFSKKDIRISKTKHRLKLKDLKTYKIIIVKVTNHIFVPTINIIFISAVAKVV